MKVLYISVGSLRVTHDKITVNLFHVEQP